MNPISDDSFETRAMPLIEGFNSRNDKDSQDTEKGEEKQLKDQIMTMNIEKERVIKK